MAGVARELLEDVGNEESPELGCPVTRWSRPLLGSVGIERESAGLGCVEVVGGGDSVGRLLGCPELEGRKGGIPLEESVFAVRGAAPVRVPFAGETGTRPEVVGDAFPGRDGFSRENP